MGGWRGGRGGRGFNILMRRGVVARLAREGAEGRIGVTGAGEGRAGRGERAGDTREAVGHQHAARLDAFTRHSVRRADMGSRDTLNQGGTAPVKP
jgi:hypothetical protein